MSVRKIVILTVIFIAVAAWSVRVYQVNAGVARTYQVKTYQTGRDIPLRNAVLHVKGVTYGKITRENGFQFVPATVTMEVRNSSNKDISISRIVETKLTYGMDYYQTMTGTFNKSELRRLSPSKSTTIILKYQVRPNRKGEKAKLYFAQDLYPRLVLDQYKKGIRYGIAVQL
ncbi:hypothetical protein [Sporolactobacillus sp. THM19-2]|uniref:hypothetical protein n=1 Tax=Sporolactobacillus sp. THM19-2 TaxID=2511171 RepID=UPI00102028B2|nr:hypothetical protein [Sporolactobacillus sp. THM19-2]RYL87309.1 hypothetical protein EWH91_13065 [Sporolactobacillus sp. THM19-2]